MILSPTLPPADCIIWFCIGIVSPYGVISGREATKKKFQFNELGANTLAKIVSVPFVAFKLLRFRDVAKYFVPAYLNIHIFAISMALMVLIFCYYACQFFLVYRMDLWDDREMCRSFELMWGDKTEV